MLVGPQIYFTYGPMFAGKTHALTKVLNDCKQVHCPVKTLRARPCERARLDQLGAENDNSLDRECMEQPKVKRLKSRTGMAFECEDVCTDDRLWSESATPSAIDAEFQGRVVIDEAQFLTARQVSELRELSCKRNVSIHCFGLRADVMNKPFEGSAHLMACAQKLTALHCCCITDGCRNDAECTINLNMTVDPKSDAPIIDVGSERYMPVCMDCWARAMY